MIIKNGITRNSDPISSLNVSAIADFLLIKYKRSVPHRHHHQRPQSNDYNTNDENIIKSDESNANSNNSFAVMVNLARSYINLDDRQQRLVAFALFFLTLFTAIYLMSRIYKFANLIKQKFQKHGIFMNPKCESIVIKMNQQIKNQKEALIANLSQKLSDLHDKTSQHTNEEKMEHLRFSDQESGNLNEVFQMDDEFLSESDIKSTRKTSSELTSVNEELDDSNKKTNLLKYYIELQKQNRLMYKKFDKSKKKPEFWSNKKRKLSNGRIESLASQVTTPSSSLSSKKLLKNISKKKSASNCSQTQPSETGSYTSTPSVVLPTILITDTASMNTIVIDLDSNEDY
jgi:hypothetical protein